MNGKEQLATSNKQQGRNASKPVRLHGFKGLVAWQKADEVVAQVFAAVEDLPAKYQWLASQALRAAVSVPANIAEGYGRGALSDYLRFLDIARGSLSELEYYIHLLERHHLVDAGKLQNVALAHAEAGRVLHGLWLATKRKPKAGWNHSGPVEANDLA
jgi:four helix bundle protein